MGRQGERKSRRIELCAGDVFKKLTVVREARFEDGRLGWECRCECGRLTMARASHMRRGIKQSCGCVHNYHGLSKHPLYSHWSDMKRRCAENPNYAHIEIDARWKDIANFIEDMSTSYKDGLTLERVDNALGYGPSNCRWATRKEQAYNRRTNRRFTLRGKSLTLAEWAGEVGLTPSGLCGRLKLGWSLEEALTRPKIRSRWER